MIEHDGTQQPIDEALQDAFMLARRELHAVAEVELHPYEIAYLVHRRGLFCRPRDERDPGVDWWTPYGWVHLRPDAEIQAPRVLNTRGAVVAVVKRIPVGDLS